MKRFKLEKIRFNYEEYSFFYERLKNDVNGTPRYKVTLIDHETDQAYAVILKGYDHIYNLLADYMERKAG